MNILFLTLASLFALPLVGGEVLLTPAQEKDIANYQPTFLLPIDHSKRPRVNLKVEVPKGFKSLQSINDFSKQENYMIEYIPEKDISSNWSEIITVNKFIGHKISANKFTDLLKENLIQNSKNGKILIEKSTNEQGIEISWFFLKYTHQNVQEIVGTTYYSGPYDSAGAQYTIRLRNGLTEQEAIKKIKSYFENSVKLQ